MGTLIRATENVYTQDQAGVRRLVAAAGDEYDPTQVPIVGIVTAPDPATASLVPLDGYDELSEPAVLELLPNMDAEQLAAVQAYERAHRARGTITRYGATSTVLTAADEPPITVPSRSLSDVAPHDELERMSVPELQAEADRRELTVEGTGKDGNVLKADLVKALSGS